MEHTLQNVTNERLARIDEVMTGVLEQLWRGRVNEDDTIHDHGGGGSDHHEGGGEGGGQPEIGKHQKLEMPLFKGEDPLGWSFRVERYFAVNGVVEAEKLDAAVVSLEGKALSWFQWLDTRTPVRTWPEFKAEVTERFHCKQAGDEYEQLMALRQMGTVSEYRERFEALSAPLGGATEEMLQGAFMNGLKVELRCDVKLMHPSNLKELMNYAGQVEDRNQARDKLQERREYKAAKNTTGSRWSDFKTAGSSLSSKAARVSKGQEESPTRAYPEKSQTVNHPGGSSVSTQYSRRRMSDAEYNRRRELGLCFRCEEKYGPNHRCKNKQLRVILMEEEDDEAQEENKA